MMTDRSNASLMIKEHVTCVVCLDVFTSPHQLHCLHSFCNKCCHELYDSSTSSLTCPVCHATSHTAPDDLPSDMKLVALVETFRCLQPPSQDSSLSVVQHNCRVVGCLHSADIGDSALCKKHIQKLLDDLLVEITTAIPKLPRDDSKSASLSKVITLKEEVMQVFEHLEKIIQVKKEELETELDARIGFLTEKKKKLSLDIEELLKKDAKLKSMMKDDSVLLNDCYTVAKSMKEQLSHSASTEDDDVPCLSEDLQAFSKKISDELHKCSLVYMPDSGKNQMTSRAWIGSPQEWNKVLCPYDVVWMDVCANSSDYRMVQFDTLDETLLDASMKVVHKDDVKDGEKSSSLPSVFIGCYFKECDARCLVFYDIDKKSSIGICLLDMYGNSELDDIACFSFDYDFQTVFAGSTGAYGGYHRLSAIVRFDLCGKFLNCYSISKPGDLSLFVALPRISTSETGRLYTTFLKTRDTGYLPTSDNHVGFIRYDELSLRDLFSHTHKVSRNSCLSLTSHRVCANRLYSATKVAREWNVHDLPVDFKGNFTKSGSLEVPTMDDYFVAVTADCRGIVYALHKSMRVSYYKDLKFAGDVRKPGDGDQNLTGSFRIHSFQKDGIILLAIVLKASVEFVDVTDLPI